MGERALIDSGRDDPAVSISMPRSYNLDSVPPVEGVSFYEYKRGHEDRGRPLEPVFELIKEHFLVNCSSKDTRPNDAWGATWAGTNKNFQDWQMAVVAWMWQAASQKASRQDRAVILSVKGRNAATSSEWDRAMTAILFLSSHSRVPAPGPLQNAMSQQKQPVGGEEANRAANVSKYQRASGQDNRYTPSQSEEWSGCDMRKDGTPYYRPSLVLCPAHLFMRLCTEMMNNWDGLRYFWVGGKDLDAVPAPPSHQRVAQDKSYASRLLTNDAILQLRAEAGLRRTSDIIVISSYDTWASRSLCYSPESLARQRSALTTGKPIPDCSADLQSKFQDIFETVLCLDGFEMWKDQAVEARAIQLLDATFVWLVTTLPTTGSLNTPENKRSEAKSSTSESKEAIDDSSGSKGLPDSSSKLTPDKSIHGFPKDKSRKRKFSTEASHVSGGTNESETEWDDRITGDLTIALLGAAGEEFKKNSSAAHPDKGGDRSRSQELAQLSTSALTAELVRDSHLLHLKQKRKSEERKIKGEEDGEPGGQDETGRSGCNPRSAEKTEIAATSPNEQKRRASSVNSEERASSSPDLREETPILEGPDKDREVCRPQ